MGIVAEWFVPRFATPAEVDGLICFYDPALGIGNPKVSRYFERAAFSNFKHCVEFIHGDWVTL
jgi:hypothetical protein